MNHTEKLKVSARYWLIAQAHNNSDYYAALKAFELAVATHVGTRNGGQPEISHQLGIFHYLRTLHHCLDNPSIVYTLAFLHDIVEDYNVSLDYLRNNFNSTIVDRVVLLSKTFGEIGNPQYSVEAIFADPHTSIVKGADRVNNLTSAIGVFKRSRLIRYRDETVDVIIPALKTSRRLFPQQEAVYENIKLVMNSHVNIINQLIDGVQYGKENEIQSAEISTQ